LTASQAAADRLFRDRALLFHLWLALPLLGCAPAVVPREPPIGTMRPGQIVLVDDRSCPPGQLKELTGGGDLAGAQPRTRRCVPRP